MSLCRVSGCTKEREGYSLYCSSHKRRQRRHGSPVQNTISAAKLRPHREAIKRWLDSRPDQNGWDPLRTLFRHLVDEARAELELVRTQATPRYLRQAHEDILKIADEGLQVVDQAILTVAAMYDLHHWEPGNFASDDGFRVQLARRFRAHSDVNVAVSWSQAVGRNKRVYRDASNRRLVTLGQLLSRALGAVSMTIIDTMGQEVDVKAQERQEAFERLKEATVPANAIGGSDEANKQQGRKPGETQGT